MRAVVNSVPAFSAVRRQPVARKSAAVRRRHLRHGIMLLGVVMVLALVFVWTRIEVIQLGYGVSRLRREVTDLKEQRNAIQAEVASLKRAERLERIARERYGMRPPQADEIVTVVPEANGFVSNEGTGRMLNDKEGVNTRAPLSNR